MKNLNSGMLKPVVFLSLKTSSITFIFLEIIFFFFFSNDMVKFFEVSAIIFFTVVLFSLVIGYLSVKEIVNPLNVKSTNLLDDLKKTSSDLKKANEKLNQVYSTIEKSPIVVFDWSIIPGTPVNYVSDNIRKYGYEPSEFLSGSLDFWEMLHPDDVSAAQEKVWTSRKIKEISETRQTYRVICKDGTLKWVEELTYYERNQFGDMISEKGILSDVTEMKNAESKIKWLTYHDKLTGLYNRTWIEDRLVTLDNDPDKAVTLMIGDMNGLKLINDLLGHKAGDELLKSMGSILRKSIRGTEYEVARLGGDEFLIVLEGANRASADKLAANIKLMCNHKISGSFTPSISWGCCARSEKERTPSEQLMNEADQMMYDNKHKETKNLKTNVLKSIQDSFKNADFTEENGAGRTMFINLLEKRLDSKVVSTLLASLDDEEFLNNEESLGN